MTQLCRSAAVLYGNNPAICNPAGSPAQATQPGQPPQPQLTVGDVQRAFTIAPWSKPSIGFQPKGNRTLVNLPSYYWVTWPAAGNQPGEIHSTTLLGHLVEIRPRVTGYRLDFGDGKSINTTSPGGEWPHGDIQHAYTKRGTFTTTVQATYTADYRIDGAGPWQPIGSTVNVAGTAARIEVLEARGQLVNTPQLED